MADWFLAAGLVRLRDQVNARYPNRDDASDGTIGDAAHSNRTSDHNPAANGAVRAWDCDEDLERDSGKQLMPLFDHLRLEAKAGREPRLKYLIYEGRICSLKTSWEWIAYTGPSPHDRHGHVSVNARADYNDSPWSLPWDGNEDDMPLTDEDVSRIGANVEKRLRPSFSALNGNVWKAIAAARAAGEAAGESADPAEIAQGVIDGLGPDLAKAVADELASRLTG